MYSISSLYTTSRSLTIISYIIVFIYQSEFHSKCTAYYVILVLLYCVVILGGREQVRQSPSKSGTATRIPVEGGKEGEGGEPTIPYDSALHIICACVHFLKVRTLCFVSESGMLSSQ